MCLPQIKRCRLDLQPLASCTLKTNSCKNCFDLKEYFEEQFNAITETVVGQNHIIMKALADQKMLVEKILLQEISDTRLTEIFPIKSVEKLSEVNRLINEDNRETYIKIMKRLLKGHLPKTLTEVIAANVCMAVNLDGVHGKKRLKNFEAFFQVLTDACQSLGAEDAEKDIRNALKVIKKRHIHSKCMKNKAINKLEV